MQRLRSVRQEEQARVRGNKQPAEMPELKRAEKKANALPNLGVIEIPSKVLTQHGRSLEAAVADLSTVRRVVEALDPWRARATGRAVSAFFGAVGKLLDLTPPDHRTEVAKSAVASLCALVKLGGDPLTNAIACAASWMDSAARLAVTGKLPLEDTKQCAAHSLQLTKGLIEAFGVRPGCSRALALLPNISEQLERWSPNPLSPEGREALWQCALTFLLDVAPLGGLTVSTAPAIQRAIQEAIKTKPKNLDALLQSAANRFRSDFAEPYRHLLEQLDADVPELAQPGRESFDKLNAALKKTAEANPTGPDELYQSIFEIRTMALETAGQQPDVWSALAAVVDRYGDTPLCGPVLSFIQAIKPDAVDLLAEADARSLAEAVIARANTSSDQIPALKKALDAIGDLPQDTSVTLALAPLLLDPNNASLPAVVAATAKAAQKGGRDNPTTQLGDFAQRMMVFSSGLNGANAGGKTPEEKAKIAQLLAEQTANRQEPATAQLLAQQVGLVENSLPAAKTANLLAEANDLAGLWSIVDPVISYKRDPKPFLQQLFQTIGQTKLTEHAGDAQEDGARVALHLATVVGQLDGDPAIPFARIQQDFASALREPEKLTWAGAKPIRLQGKGVSIAGFLGAHGALPCELALTAGLHLDSDQLTWLINKAENTRGRDTVRALRDFVFGCIEHGDLTLLDAVRNDGASSKKATSRVMAFVARAYRENKLVEVSFDRLREGLEKGEDPVAAIEEELGQAALQKIGLGEVGGAKVTPEGLEVLKKCRAAITALQQGIDRDLQWDGGQASDFKEPFRDVLLSVAQGTYPASKYDSEVGQKTMSVLELTKEQQAIWRQELVTSLNQEADPVELPQLTNALASLRGLALTMKKHLELPKGLNWDDASRAKVEEVLQKKLDLLHESKKGTKKHKEAGAAAGQQRTLLAMLRLVLAVENAGDNTRALAEMRGVLNEAMGPLRKNGLGVGVQILNEALQASHLIKGATREGIYCADEDGLEPSLMSAKGGCVYYDGARRWANICFAANANERTLRVYDPSGNFVYRSYLKVYKGEIDDYKGPVLWLSEAKPNGGSSEHEQLIFRHAVAKAKAMGIPLVTMPMRDSRAACNDLTQAAEALGLKQEKKRITIGFPTETATGWTYPDYWTGRKPDGSYDNANGYNHNVRKAANGEPFLTREYDFNVVMP